MPPTKNLYVGEDDVSVWEQAEVLAKLSRLSQSQIATAALREFMAGDALHPPLDEARS